MSWGVEFNTEKGTWLWGFESIEDWLLSVLLSFPGPWTLAPREGKYYGTALVDARGKEVLSFWDTGEGQHEPSHREKEYFGEWTPEAWAEWCCDSHWESEEALALAESVLQARNDAEWGPWSAMDALRPLLPTIVQRARWEDDVFAEVVCGGPDRRQLEPTSRLGKQILGGS